MTRALRFLLMMTLVMSLLIAGCTSPPPEYQEFPRVSPAPTPHPGNLSGPAWISINNFCDPTVSSPFVINGTTNLEANTVLEYTVYSHHGLLGHPNVSPEMFSTVFPTIVRKGEGDINTWSIDTIVWYPGDATVKIWNRQGSGYAMKDFNVRPG